MKENNNICGKINSVDEFIKNIENYFGPYKGNSKIYIIRYLNKKIDELKLSVLFDYVCYSHQVRYGPPGISDFEYSIEQAAKNRKGEVFIHKREKIVNKKIEEINDDQFNVCKEKMTEVKNRIAEKMKKNCVDHKSPKKLFNSFNNEKLRLLADDSIVPKEVREELKNIDVSMDSDEFEF